MKLSRQLRKEFFKKKSIDAMYKEAVTTDNKLSIKVGDKVETPSGLSKVISISNDKIIVRSQNPVGDFEYSLSDVQKI